MYIIHAVKRFAVINTGSFNFNDKEVKIRTRHSTKGRHFSVDLDEVKLPSGRVTERIKVHHPDSVAILPFISDDEVLLVRQWRYSLGRETLEIPAGKLNP
ncbi:MAG: hypothetical protein ACXAEU_12250, partial [Candidatus Hodarchaeales archaeon]